MPPSDDFYKKSTYDPASPKIGEDLAESTFSRTARVSDQRSGRPDSPQSPHISSARRFVWPNLHPPLGDLTNSSERQPDHHWAIGHLRESCGLDASYVNRVVVGTALAAR